MSGARVPQPQAGERLGQAPVGSPSAALETIHFGSIPALSILNGNPAVVQGCEGGTISTPARRPEHQLPAHAGATLAGKLTIERA